jgi:hypothetical protein
VLEVFIVGDIADAGGDLTVVVASDLVVTKLLVTNWLFVSVVGCVTNCCAPATLICSASTVVNKYLENCNLGS